MKVIDISQNSIGKVTKQIFKDIISYTDRNDLYVKSIFLPLYNQEDLYDWATIEPDVPAETVPIEILEQMWENVDPIPFPTVHFNDGDSDQLIYVLASKDKSLNFKYGTIIGFKFIK